MNAIRGAVVLAAVTILTGSALAATLSGPVAITGPVTSVDADSATLKGTVNPGGEPSTWRFEYGKTTSYGSKTPWQNAGNGTANVDVAAVVSGLDAGTTYHYRLLATNDDGTATGSDGIFTTTGAEPKATTGSATDIGPTSALLRGTVDPNGQATTAYFDYGSSTSYGKRTVTTNVGSGTSAKDFSARITGLTPGKTYHFRLVAKNASGTDRGSDRTFRTDPGPSATTDDAVEVTSSSAVLRGKVDPNGRATSYYFDYGRSTKYGSRTPTTSAGSSQDDVVVSQRITGLRTDRTYRFRLVAINEAGTAKGKDKRFRTTTGPFVETGPAADFTATTASAVSFVIPGGRSTSTWIEYGTSTRYGSSTPEQSVGSGYDRVTTAFVLTGLRPDTTYHFRARASNSAGRSSGRDATFRTPGGGAPLATTSRLTSLGPFSARITGLVNPRGVPTTAYFEYGRTQAFGRRAGQVRLDGTTTRRVAARLTGLQPGRRYYYRVVAVSTTGSSVGRTASFGTPPLPRDANGRVVRCTIVGTQWPDVLRGTNRRDVICGFGGNDRIIGRGGNDIVYAGPGDDRIDGGAGNDTVFAGAGRDELVGGNGNDRLFGQNGVDRIFGNAGNDRLVGGYGRDTLVGGTGSDTLLGGPDNDTIFARDGRKDVVDGGRGRDTATLDRRLDRYGSVERRRF